MILKFRVRDREGWTYIADVARVDTAGPIVDPETQLHRSFHSHDEIVEWAKGYWGAAGLDAFAFTHWPHFRQGSHGLGGDSDVYSIVQVTVWLTDDRVGLVFLTQDEAFLLSESGDSIDRLR